MDHRPPNYYQLLDLQGQESAATLSSQDVRTAYRQALLKNHPDKTGKNPSQHHGGTDSLQITVDDIALAYKTLSDPKLRADYDRWLQNAASSPSAWQAGEKPLRTGMETVDLDDLAYDTDKDAWSRGCRCGEAKGYVVCEADLEQHVDDGEVIVGCKGCSLWLRVLFSVET